MNNNKKIGETVKLILLVLAVFIVYTLFFRPDNNNTDTNETKIEETQETNVSSGEAQTQTESEQVQTEEEVSKDQINKGQAYYSKDDVALYLHTYGQLPPNYLTKDEAYDLGWEPSEGNLWDVTDLGVIGGDYFGNREGLLPDGHQYYEADVNYSGGFRGAERLVYTDQGQVIYFTGDHYESFEVLYE